MQIVIGKCGACGGSVALVGTWSAHPSLKQPGTCLSCWRTTKAQQNAHALPVFEMVAPQRADRLELAQDAFRRTHPVGERNARY